jgi:lipopolysaccharide kinase (Kdo/WaaP) family protein
MPDIAANRRGVSLPKTWTEFQSGRYSWRMHSEFALPTVREKLRCPEAMMAAPSEPLRVDAQPRSTFLVKAVWPEFPDIVIVIKRYRATGLARILSEWLRPSRARRAFDRAVWLLQSSIPAAAPIAVGERRRGLWGKESYLITELVPHARPLRQVRAASTDVREGRRLVRALAVLMARLHDAGLAHTDPSLSNFLVQRADDGTFRLVLIDLDGVRQRSRQSLEAAAADLRVIVRRIPVSPRERLWFAAQYCRARAHRPSARKLITLLDPKA